MGCSNSKSMVGRTAEPLTTLEFVHGNPVNIEPGKITIVEFWATWCPPCRATVPHMNSLQSKYRGRVSFVGISTEEKMVVEEFVQSVGVQYSIALATPGSQITKAYPVKGIPHCFLVGKDGQIAWEGHPMDKLESRIDKALQA